MIALEGSDFGQTNSGYGRGGGGPPVAIIGTISGYRFEASFNWFLVTV